jgi:ribonuclease HI
MADEDQPGEVISLWTDGSKSEDGRVGAAAVHRGRDSWKARKFGLGNNKEVFDAELYGIAETLKIAQGLALQQRENCKTVRIFSDSQAALKRLQQTGLLSQWLTTRIREQAERLRAQGLKVGVR